MKQLSCHKAVLLFDFQHYLKDPDILKLELPYYKQFGKISDSHIVSQCILYRPTALPLVFKVNQWAVSRPNWNKKPDTCRRK